MLALEVIIDKQKSICGEALGITEDRANQLGLLLEEMIASGFTGMEALAGISLYVKSANELAFISITIGFSLEK